MNMLSVEPEQLSWITGESPCSAPVFSAPKRRASEIVSVTFDGLAGTFHRPIGPGCGLTVVISPPVGREACCAYRPLFAWAEMLASRGFHVLRYDHRGEGDSLPRAPGADQWACWLDGFERAAKFARERTGPQALALAGLRLGATLAMAAARAVEPDALLLLAPIVSGEAWLKELRLSAAMQNVKVDDWDRIEVNGLQLTPATCRSLSTLNLTSFDPARQKVFLAGPSPTPELLRTLGPELTRIPFHNYVKLFKDAHLNEAPTRVFETAAEWLVPVAGGVPSARSAEPPPAPRLETAKWIEEAVTFGEGLRGILCSPAQGRDDRAVIFGNTAGDPRASLGGFAADACRALASAGVSALRFDFYGFGESADRFGKPTHIYTTSHVEEFRLAADLLRRRGCKDVTLAGVCTGGYHAVRAVLECAEFRGALVFNCWLVWRPGMSLGFRAVRMRDVIRPARVSTRIRRLLRGEFKPSELARGLVHPFRLWWSTLWPDEACRAVQADFRRGSVRGMRLKIVLGEGDAATNELQADFGRGFRRLAGIPGLSIQIRRGIDHAVQSERSKSLAIAELLRFMELGPPLRAELGEVETFSEPANDRHRRIIAEFGPLDA